MELKLKNNQLKQTKHTFSISHRVKEAPGCFRPSAAFDECYIVGGLDADDSKQLHVQTGNDAVILQHRELWWNLKATPSVFVALLVTVSLEDSLLVSSTH